MFGEYSDVDFEIVARVRLKRDLRRHWLYEKRQMKTTTHPIAVHTWRASLLIPNILMRLNEDLQKKIIKFQDLVPISARANYYPKVTTPDSLS